VRLHESMLFDPITERTNFCAKKLTSFEAFEQLNIPNERVVSCFRARDKPAAAKSSASSQLAGRSAPFSRTIGSVSRPRYLRNQITSSRQSRPAGGVRICQRLEKTSGHHKPNARSEAVLVRALTSADSAGTAPERPARLPHRYGERGNQARVGSTGVPWHWVGVVGRGFGGWD
jgi:hypothetical protein